MLRYLEQRQCPFVPRLLDSDADTLKIVTSNCGSIVEHISDDRAQEIFQELEQYGVRHEDPFPRNITYRATDGRFCAIDFEFAEILDKEAFDALTNPKEVCQAAREYKLSWSGLTDRGRFRPNNEDVFLLLLMDDSGIRYLGKTGAAESENCDFIFAVSDGMGGEQSGEFASRIALEKIIQLLPKEFSLSEDRILSYSKDILTNLFSSIHATMIELGRFDSHCRDMGATLTLGWFRNGFLHFAHVGDSRLYLLRDSKLHQLSEDHTYVGWMRRQGKLNEREAREHPRKNALDQALGAQHQFLKPNLGIEQLQHGDKFLLCSDGVTEALWDHRIEHMLANTEQNEAAELVRLSVRESGRDNATAVVVNVNPITK